MIKLNNKGWGLSAFIAYIAIFISAIILVAFLSAKNGMGPNVTNILTNNKDDIELYKEYEQNVKESSIIYQEEYYPNFINGNRIKVDIQRLGVKKEITYKCSGYVIIEKKNGIFSYLPYLNCGSYKTEGYSK